MQRAMYGPGPAISDEAIAAVDDFAKYGLISFFTLGFAAAELRPVAAALVR